MQLALAYYCDHSGSDYYASNDKPNENHLLVGDDAYNASDIITVTELNQTMLLADPQTNNCTVLIFGSRMSNGFINSLYRPERTIVTTVNNDEYAQARSFVAGDSARARLEVHVVLRR